MNASGSIPSVRTSVKVPGARALLKIAGLLLLSACTGLTPDLVVTGELKVERVDSHSVRIGLVQAQAIDKELYISGHLDETFSGRGRIPGHIDIEILGEDGRILSQTTTRAVESSPKASEAHFSATLTLPSRSDMQSIRVIHHEAHSILATPEREPSPVSPTGG